MATLLGTIEYFFLQQGEEIKNAGIDSFYRNLVRKNTSFSHKKSFFKKKSFKQKGTPAKLIYTVSNLLIMAAIPFRFLQLLDGEGVEEHYRVVEEKLLAIAIPGIWFYLMFFAG